MMPRKRIRYTDEVRRQMVGLVRAGRSPVDLAREFEPTAETIRGWVARADRDGDRPEPNPSTAGSAELRRLHRDVARVRQECDILARAAHEIRPEDGRQGVFRFMEANKVDFPVRTMARLLGVSTSSYYAWRTRPFSAREVADSILTQHIREIHWRSRGAYGAPQMEAALVKLGYRIGLERVARLMRKAGLRGTGGPRNPAAPASPTASTVPEVPPALTLGPRARKLFPNPPR